MVRAVFKPSNIVMYLHIYTYIYISPYLYRYTYIHICESLSMASMDLYVDL